MECPGYEDTQRIIRGVNKYVTHLTRESAESMGKAALGVGSAEVVVRLLCCVFAVFVDYVNPRVVGDDVVNALRSIVSGCIK